MARLRAAHVLVVGVGGVGSWCAEALVRTGLGRITIVDDDVVAESNVNRQCPATSRTIGRPKVEAMAERLHEISPVCEVTAVAARFAGEVSGSGLASGSSVASRSSMASDSSMTSTSSMARLSSYDLVIDAIDSIDSKATLILAATEAGVPIVSSMGAALRLDPTKVRVTRFEKVEGDGLARALRQRFKKLRRFPAAKFPCVWSAEQAVSQSVSHSIPKGSLMPVTATFGMCLASEAIKILTTEDTNLAKGGAK